VTIIVIIIKTTLIEREFFLPFHSCCAAMLLYNILETINDTHKDKNAQLNEQLHHKSLVDLETK